MRRELLNEMAYTPLSSYDLPDSLIRGNNRREISKHHVSSPEEVVDSISETLGLTVYKERETGRNRVLRVMHTTLHMPNFGQDRTTPVRLGVAVEGPIDARSTIEVGSQALIIRQSAEGFHTEDFANEVDDLVSYDRGFFQLPRRLRGSALEHGIVAGLAAGAAAGIWLTGDSVSAMTFGVSASVIAATAGHYFDEVDQYHLAEKVPHLEEYFGGGRAVTKLKRIVNYLDTIKVLTALDESLKHMGVHLPTGDLRQYWQTDGEIDLLKKRYNILLSQEERGGEGADRIDLLGEMVKYIQQKSAVTSL